MKRLAFAAPFVFGFTALVSAQTPGPAPARPATLDDVVAEVRALRADLQRIEASSIHAQLLVTRLQGQEQRIATIARELAETDAQIRVLEASRNPMTEKLLKDLAEQPAKPGEADFMAGFKAQLEKIQNGDPELKERQASLSRLLADEQARWTSFNAQLEALERELSVRKPR